jgi:putative NADPH-quinone reductase
MQILIILAHPDHNSFNHALAHAIRAVLSERGHQVVFHDLCAEAFEPLLPAGEIPQEGKVTPLIRQHCAELAAADGIVVVHPNWWGQPPAILTGWIDRVFRPGVAYRFDSGDSGEGVPVSLLKARAALVINTSNTPDAREKAAFGDPLERIWRHCIFEVCGVRRIERRVFNVIVTSSREQRHAWLDEARQLAADLFRDDSRKKPSFKEHLLSMPNVGKDEDFERGPQINRPVEL